MTEAMKSVVADLLDLLRSRPQDTTWSSAESAAALLAQIERAASLLEQDDPSGVQLLTSLFLPTGALQETALSSGWGEQYLVLADRFDAAVAG